MPARRRPRRRARDRVQARRAGRAACAAPTRTFRGREPPRNSVTTSSPPRSARRASAPPPPRRTRRWRAAKSSKCAIACRSSNGARPPRASPFRARTYARSRPSGRAPPAWRRRSPSWRAQIEALEHEVAEHVRHTLDRAHERRRRARAPGARAARRPRLEEHVAGARRARAPSSSAPPEQSRDVASPRSAARPGRAALGPRLRLRVTQVTALLAHDLTWAGFGRSMLVLALVWWAWSAFVWAANAQDTGAPDAAAGAAAGDGADLRRRASRSRTPSATRRRCSPSPTPACGSCTSRSTRTPRGAATRRGRRSPASRVTVVDRHGAADRGLVPRTAPRRSRCGRSPLAIDYAGPAWLTRERLRGLQQVAVAHFAERYGLFIIICLGESIVAIGVGASEQRARRRARRGGGARPAHHGRRCGGRTSTASRRPPRSGCARHDDPVLAAADAYSYLHLVLVAGIIVFAVGVKVADPRRRAHRSSDAARLALCGGVALYLVGHAAFRLRMVGASAHAKLVAVGALAVLFVVGGGLAAWALAGLVTAVLVALSACRDARASGARRRHSVREVGRALLEERADRLGRRAAVQRHDLLAVLVLDRRLLGRDLERRPHALLGQADAPRRPGGDLLGRLERALEQRVVRRRRRRPARSARPPRRRRGGR